MCLSCFIRPTHIYSGALLTADAATSTYWSAELAYTAARYNLKFWHLNICGNHKSELEEGHGSEIQHLLACIERKTSAYHPWKIQTWRKKWLFWEIKQTLQIFQTFYDRLMFSNFNNFDAIRNKIDLEGGTHFPVCYAKLHGNRDCQQKQLWLKPCTAVENQVWKSMKFVAKHLTPNISSGIAAFALGENSAKLKIIKNECSFFPKSR